MLQVDPMKRATMDDIKNHEWFKKDLPAYLFPPPNEADASIVDIDAVQVSRSAIPEFIRLYSRRLSVKACDLIRRSSARNLECQKKRCTEPC